MGVLSNAGHRIYAPGSSVHASHSIAGRTIGSSVYNMFVQASSAVAAQIYRKDDAPRYRRGNKILIV
ncbi:hypothetical protein MPER_02160, partial [Moniliophthora perniciosa FA553]